MALELSAEAVLLKQQVNVNPQIILEIDGIPNIFGSDVVLRVPKYGDVDLIYGMPGLFYGVPFETEGQKDLISLEGTTTTLSQQIQIDKGGANSVQRFNLTLIDKDGFMSSVLQPGNNVEDPLSLPARIFLNFANGGAHPRDSLRIFVGNITEIDFPPGECKLTIAHPEQLKRQELFTKRVTNLSGAMDASQLSSTVLDTTGWIPPGDLQRTFIKVEEEIMEISSFTGTVFTIIQRGSLNTIAVIHDDETEVESFYKLTGDPIDLALKLMISGSIEPFKTEVTTNFRTAIDGTVIENAIFFENIDIQDKVSLITNDTMSVSGAANPANNFTDRIIAGFGKISSGSFIVVSGSPLVDEVGASSSTFKSQFNTMNEGCGISPEQIDVKQFKLIKDTFGSDFVDAEPFIKDGINAKEFLDQEILFPFGMVSVPRKGRISAVFQAPPLALSQARVIDESTILNANKLSIKRSVNKNFYNVIQYAIEEDSIEDKFLQKDITISATSQNRIKVGNNPLIIESKALRDTPESRIFIERQSRRFLDRYKFAAEEIKPIVNYKTGVDLEVGDQVIFGTAALQITDINLGTRDFIPRLMEIVNKSLAITDGKITLTLLDTKQQLDGRNGVIAPCSLVSNGATLTRLPLQKSFSTESFEFESVKWEGLENQILKVRRPDFSVVDEFEFLGFESTFSDVMLVSGLSFIPSENDIIDPRDYKEPDPSIDATMKEQFMYINPSVVVVSGSSTTIFDIPPGEAGTILVGSIVRVHSIDFTRDSSPLFDDIDAVVTDVTGNTITVDRSLTFIPVVGDIIDLIGFTDGGLPYRIF